MKKKHVFTFGNGKAEGDAQMKAELGGKGANLAEMNKIGIPVPPGFTITTDVCMLYISEGAETGKKLIHDQVIAGIKHIEKIMGTKFGDKDNPCLVSVRSGGKISMPGMMDTVLNLGLNEDAVVGIAKQTGNDRFAWDSYRRFINMYADVVMGIDKFFDEDENPFEDTLEEIKHRNNYKLDTDLTTENLREVTYRFKQIVKDYTGQEFPTDPYEQLWTTIEAVFRSWQNERAILYRRLNNIPDDWGTAVNVQAMVFGNMGDDCATGVAFTRNASNGEHFFNGEYLINAQGEDVVAGIRTPQQITIRGAQMWAQSAGMDEKQRQKEHPSMEESMPEVYKELFQVQLKLEKHYRDMQDIEFTIQKGKLWLLQTRGGKRTGRAMIKIALDMLQEGILSEEEAVLRMDPNKLGEMLHPVFHPKALKEAQVIAKGLPASPGAATGRIVFTAKDAEESASRSRDVILVRIETSPEDLKGMHAAKGILTTQGGMTSHAAVVARGMGKCCVSGAGTLKVNYKKRTVITADGTEFKEGEFISLNGTTGEVYAGRIPTDALGERGDCEQLLELADKHARLAVRTNADTPADAKQARAFGAKGIGLCRTEHMFFQENRIRAMQEMILAHDQEGRERALEKLLPMQRSDFEGIFEAMNGFPVTIRLLDPPLHEFVPHEHISQSKLAKALDVSIDYVISQVNALDEFNPMLGHRGCRLGISYPEITAMQARAIFEAALNMKLKGIKVYPEIMVPLVSIHREFLMQKEIIDSVAQEVFEEMGDKIDYKVGTMIETPRAALTAEHIAENAEFFSFGTNDLTQMTWGFSRDDVGKFINEYIEKGIIKRDPFVALDQVGVGKLVERAKVEGRKIRPDLKVGICGEHGGEPTSVEFCHRIGLDYVSCSPFRVTTARLSAAQAHIKEKLGIE